jgi:hypothetical protein
MAFFSSSFDIQLIIYRTVGTGNLTGFQSQYATKPVPATGKKIEGFKFDETFWRSDLEENNAIVQPTNWDSFSGGLEENFQSGVGDGDDLKVEEVIIENKGDDAESQEVWLPKILHGYFYGGKEEYYLYSDDAVTEYPTVSGLWVSELDTTISGGNYLELDFVPKPGIPVLARSYKWNNTEGYYEIDDSANHVIEFTPKFIDEDEAPITEAGDEIIWPNLSLGYKEFITRENSKVIFNQNVVKQVGRYLTTFSGYSSDEIGAMELVGTTDGTDYQELHLDFVPIDRLATAQILVTDGTVATEYLVVSEFSIGGSEEVVIDYDLGILKFGSSTEGGRPNAALSVYASYFKTFALEYEPENSRNHLIDSTANINPINRFKGDGFVFIRQKASDPATLELSADLPEISEDYFGPLYLGNDFSKLLATVKSTSGETIEGQRVYFELLTTSVGSFGNDTLGEGLSNSDGVAKTLYNPPRTIDDIGGVTDTVSTTLGESTLFLSDYIPPSNEETLFLFQVHAEDNILGIPKADLLSFYETYIQEQGSTAGQSTGPTISINISTLGDFTWVLGAYQDLIKWEILHRSFHDFSTPTIYEVGDLRTGKKTIVATLDASAVNPHTGTTPAFMPLQPSAFTVTDSGTYVQFPEELSQITSSGLHKSYMVVGPTKATVRAYTINDRTGQTIYSNTIDILIDIPETANGIVHIDAINSVPSGLVGNAYFYDQEEIELEHVNITSTGLMPLGWRIRSPDITIASALDSITFLDINPLTEPDDTIEHEFTISEII